MYTATINQNGLILLNKSARQALGVKLGDRVTINVSRGSAVIKRELSDDEFFSQLDAIKSPQSVRNIKKYAGHTADELFKSAVKKSIAKGEFLGYGD